MNRRVEMLDRYTMVSNSDAHLPAKLGRESNLIDASARIGRGTNEFTIQINGRARKTVPARLSQVYIFEFFYGCGAGDPGQRGVCEQAEQHGNGFCRRIFGVSAVERHGKQGYGPAKN